MIRCPFCKLEFTPTINNTRSNQQCRYYFGVCVKLISEELGYSPSETHEILKSKFLKQIKFIETKEGIEEIETRGDTKSLSTVQFESFLSEVRQWASMYLGLFLPLPGEISYD